jgi:Cu/Ag efflux pump CusA
MVVLVAFLFEWRTALISLVAIPLSLLAGLSCSTCAAAPSTP